MQGHLQHSTTEMELLRKSLDTARASEASHKMEIDLLQHLSGEQQIKAQRIEKEVNNTYFHYFQYTFVLFFVIIYEVDCCRLISCCLL